MAEFQGLTDADNQALNSLKTPEDKGTYLNKQYGNSISIALTNDNQIALAPAGSDYNKSPQSFYKVPNAPVEKKGFWDGVGDVANTAFTAIGTAAQPLPGVKPEDINSITEPVAEYAKKNWGSTAGSMLLPAIAITNAENPIGWGAMAMLAGGGALAGEAGQRGIETAVDVAKGKSLEESAKENYGRDPGRYLTEPVIAATGEALLQPFIKGIAKFGGYALDQMPKFIKLGEHSIDSAALRAGKPEALSAVKSYLEENPWTKDSLIHQSILDQLQLAPSNFDRKILNKQAEDLYGLNTPEYGKWEARINAISEDPEDAIALINEYKLGEPNRLSEAYANQAELAWNKFTKGRTEVPVPQKVMDTNVKNQSLGQTMVTEAKKIQQPPVPEHSELFPHLTNKITPEDTGINSKIQMIQHLIDQLSNPEQSTLRKGLNLFGENQYASSLAAPLAGKAVFGYPVNLGLDKTKEELHSLAENLNGILKGGGKK